MALLTRRAFATIQLINVLFGPRIRKYRTCSSFDTVCVCVCVCSYFQLVSPKYFPSSPNSIYFDVRRNELQLSANGLGVGVNFRWTNFGCR